MKERAIESRFGFVGGVNYSATQDGIANNELMLCTNARVNVGGDVQRRRGIRKQNGGSLLGSASVPQVVGLAHWHGPTGTGFEYMAIANSRFYTSPDLEMWTERATLTASGSSFPSFFAEMVAGASTIIYFTSSLRLYSWNGTSVVDLTSTASAPPATVLGVYNSRLFTNDVNSPQEVHWSALGDGGDWTVGGLSGAGSAVLELSEGDSITALMPLGASLLIATSKGVARFTGTADDIQLLTDTQGVTADIGPMVISRLYPGQGGFQRCEQTVLMFTERGPYLVTEGGLVSIAEKLLTSEPDVKWLPRSRPFVGYDPDRNEVWFVFRAESEGDAAPDPNYGSTAMVWNTVRRCFSGPMTLPAEVCTLAVLPHPDNRRPTLYGGFADRLVRVLADGGESRDGTGDDYTHTIRFAPFIFDAAGPQNIKALRHVYLQVQRASLTTVPVVKVYPDGAAAVTATLVSSTGAVNTPANLRYDVNVQGRRFVVEVSGAYADGADGDNPQIIGAVVEGSVMDRW